MAIKPSADWHHRLSKVNRRLRNSKPHAQTLEEGEAVENQMAQQAEQKAKAEQDPANQARAEQEKIESEN